MAASGAFGQAMGKLFRLDAAPVVTARTLRKVDFASTRLTNTSPNHGLTLPIPREDTFLVALQLADFRAHELWLEAQQCALCPTREGPSVW